MPKGVIPAGFGNAMSSAILCRLGLGLDGMMEGMG